METTLQVGQTYRLRHSRFGNAVVTVKAIPCETWIAVEIKSGVLRGVNNCWEPGDCKSVRRVHCIFTPTTP